MANGAQAKGEHWVKKDSSPTYRWLIDTDAPNYREQVADIIAREHPVGADDIQPFIPTDHLSLVPQPQQQPSCTLNLLLAWPELFQWLNEQGLLIFRNALVQDGVWQWQWGDLEGEGYTRFEAALLGALQARVAQGLAPCSQTLCVEIRAKDPARRKFWFSR
jgi:hypothetical protein